MKGQFCDLKPEIFCQESAGCRGCQVYADALTAQHPEIYETQLACSACEDHQIAENMRELWIHLANGDEQ